MDFTSNGRLDILTGSIGGQVSVFRRKPNGTYAAGETLRLNTGSPIDVGRSSSVAAANWNGDGKFVLIIGSGDGAVYWIPNQGTKERPVFGPPERLHANGHLISAEGGSAGPFVADWDGDGLLDLVLGSASGKVVWYHNVGTKEKPQLAAPVTLIEAANRDSQGVAKSSAAPKRSGPYSKVCVADWNGDGRPDLIVGDYSYSSTPPAQPHGWVWVYLRATTVAANLESPRY